MCIIIIIILHSTIFIALLSVVQSHMREFTLGPLRESWSVPGGCQLIGQVANLTFEQTSLTKFSIPLSHRISMTSYLFSLSQSQHTLFTLCYSDQATIITQSHSSILPSCFTSSLEPASYITQDYSSSKLFIPLSATFIRTCRFNLIHTAIAFDHFFTVSL